MNILEKYISDILTKVEQLKCSFSVEGLPLIKSDKFSDEDNNNFKIKSNSHPSHWNHLNDKIWNDEEIAEQIITLLNIKSYNDITFKDLVNKIMKTISYIDLTEDTEKFKTVLFKELNYDKLTPFNQNFWKNFGSAPFDIDERFSNNTLLEFKEKYGACGMSEIFGNKFKSNYHLTYLINNTLSEFNSKWIVIKEKKDLNIHTFNSPYNNIDEIENNVTINKIIEEAKIFYHDKTKNFNDRIKVFTKYGESNDWIFYPVDYNLHKIFELYMESEINRNQIIETPYIVEWWIEKLKNYRCEFNWINQYHPKLLTTKRNYNYSDKALDRLYHYYMEKLFLEEIGSFEFDW